MFLKTHTHLNNIIFLFIIIIITGSQVVQAQMGKKMDYKSSWLGNSLPGSDGWVLQAVDDIYVTPDGTVYTNVPWDEHGGNVMAFKDGQFVSEARVGNHGGGHTITANSNYIFFAGNKHRTGDQGIDRRDISNIFDKSKNIHVDCGTVYGIVATDDRVYASVQEENKIKVFDTNLNYISEWNLENPGELAIDEQGTIWIIQKELNKISRYDLQGKKLPQEIILNSQIIPTDICVDNKGRLLLADAGVNQQIHLFKNIDTQPIIDDRLGINCGVFSGDNPGEKQPLKFYNPTGIGVDNKGNIYIGNKSDVNNNGATLLQSYSPDGDLLWEVSASLWIDCVDADPENENILYGGGEKFIMDYSKPIGKEATLTAFTANPFVFPDDSRIGYHGHGGGYQRGATWMRSVKGNKIMFLTSMNGLPISIYRFEPSEYGEIAIPCGRVSGSEIWIDQNGNGQEESGEFEKQNIGNGMGGWVDSEGTIWHCDEDGFDRMYLQKINRYGVPVYSGNATQSFPLPDPFTELRRIRHYPERDNMLILNGFTDEYPDISHHWKRSGKVFHRYNNWSPNNWELVWEFVPPFEDRQTGNFGDGNVQGIAVVDNYLFLAPNGSSEKLGVARGHVDVYDLNTTEKIGWMEPGPHIQEGDPNEGPHNVGIMDINDGLNVIKRSNGEYLVFFEDDWNTKNLMYRWCPSGDCK